MLETNNIQSDIQNKNCQNLSSQCYKLLIFPYKVNTCNNVTTKPWLNHNKTIHRRNTATLTGSVAHPWFTEVWKLMINHNWNFFKVRENEIEI